MAQSSENSELLKLCLSILKDLLKQIMVNNYIRNTSSCNTGSFKPDNLEIVWIITN